MLARGGVKFARAKQNVRPHRQLEQLAMEDRMADRSTAALHRGSMRIGATILWLAVFVGGAGVAYAQQDVVITTNGDKLVGEIKGVEKDVLTIETPYSDSDFKIEWGDIVSLASDRQFLVETFDGRRITGSLKVDPDKKLAVLIADTSVQLADVSAAQPFERTFWSRFDTAVDFGYSMTRTNSAKQLSLGANLTYRDARYVDVVFANIFSSTQENAPETQRWDVANDFRRLLGSRWYANTTQEFLNSEEQGLDLRTTIGGGGGRYILRSAPQYLAVGGGLAWTNENYTDPTLLTKDSAEAYLGTEFMTEKLKITDLITRFTWYPSLTISDRYRLAYRLDLDFNLPGDWYFRLGIFDNYDSQPPAGFSSNDYGWSNAFGFKF
jgi:putative salt-induced outer membrane protein YdiY